MFLWQQIQKLKAPKLDEVEACKTTILRSYKEQLVQEF